MRAHATVVQQLECTLAMPQHGRPVNSRARSSVAVGPGPSLLSAASPVASRRVRCSAAVKSVPATRPPSDALRVTRARRRRTKVTEIDQRNEGHHRNTHVPDERVQRVLHARVQRVQKQENSKRAPTTRAADNREFKQQSKKTGKYRLNGKIPATFSGK